MIAFLSLQQPSKTRCRTSTSSLVQFLTIISLVQLTVSLTKPPPVEPIHTLILTRHGDSLWNGKEPGSRETFTGWTDIPLSSIGESEARRTGKLLSQYTSGIEIDALFTSTLGRARMTAHYCWWSYYERLELEYRQMKQYQYYNPPKDRERQALLDERDNNDWLPKQFLIDHRLNERHYGSLQGLVKSDTEAGLHGHSPADVVEWRRSWHSIPPLLEDDDPRRIEELRLYRDICGGAENVPRGESLAMVAKERIQPFLEESLTPLLDSAYFQSRQSNHDMYMDSSRICNEGGTALIVAHANSLRALIGVICNVENDSAALQKLESMKIPTASPLVLRYRKCIDSGAYCPVACSLESEFKADLPVYPLTSVQLSMLRRSQSNQEEVANEGKVAKVVANVL